MQRVPAVFLDKDGTVVEDVPYNVDPARLRFTRGAIDGLRLVAEHGFPLVLVSNQSGIARGYFDAAALMRLQTHLERMLLAGGVRLAGFYFCPHGPQADCTCRKPAPGLLHEAAAALGIDLARSWMIGDRGSDVEAGRRAGCRTVQLGAGGPGGEDALGSSVPDFRCADLLEAARHVIGTAA